MTLEHTFALRILHTSLEVVGQTVNVVCLSQAQFL